MNLLAEIGISFVKGFEACVLLMQTGIGTLFNHFFFVLGFISCFLVASFICYVLGQLFKELGKPLDTGSCY
jgi:hypothetical protein